MKILLDFSFNELLEFVFSLGEQKFRASQLFSALNLYKDEAQISNLPKTLKDKLISLDCVFCPLKIEKSLKGKDGSEKFIYKLWDGNIIEGVLMKYEYGNTLCVSTQVGCRMKCKFCASGQNFCRNLTSGEILAQVLCVNSYLSGGLKDKRKITNIVLMGSGEPLDNYDNVLKFLKCVTAEEGINISPRNISLSTCGIVPKMLALAEEGLPLTLTVSLHASTDEKRQRIMPIANKFSISEIISASKNYFQKTGRRVIFEYALIKGENDTEGDAKRLATLLAGFPTHLNIIPLNTVKENNLESPTRKEAYEFMGKMEKLGQSATVRRTIGEDIEGACGQLRAKIISEGKA